MTPDSDDMRVSPTNEHAPIVLDYHALAVARPRLAWSLLFWVFLVHSCFLGLSIATAIEPERRTLSSLMTEHLSWWSIVSFLWNEHDVGMLLMCPLSLVGAFGSRMIVKGKATGRSLLKWYGVAAILLVVLDVLTEAAMAFGPPLVFARGSVGWYMIVPLGWESFDATRELIVAAPILLCLVVWKSGTGTNMSH